MYEGWCAQSNPVCFGTLYFIHFVHGCEINCSGAAKISPPTLLREPTVDERTSGDARRNNAPPKGACRNSYIKFDLIGAIQLHGKLFPIDRRDYRRIR